ncbi:MAG: HAD-IIIA family hydrolase [Beijerinckiaceae bacterium]
MLVNQVIIQVGGTGTRLGDVACVVPKPSLPIQDDCCFLDYLLDNVARQGFTDILLLAGYLGDQVEDRYGGTTNVYGAHLRVIRETVPRGTAGALAEIGDNLASEFLLMNGDAFVDINLRSFERRAAELALPAVIASLAVEDPRRYVRLATIGSRVHSFLEKDASASGPAAVNAGIYRLSDEVVKRIRHSPASIETDVFPELAANGVLGHIPVSGWSPDLGSPKTRAIARTEMPSRIKRPCVIFDRDNTLIVDKGYTHRPQDLQWIAGAQESIRRLNDSGWRVVVCTNQAGVAYGFYDEAAVIEFHRAMNADLAEIGCFIDAFYYCPYHAGGVVERYRLEHEDRKPNPGMILRAMRELNVDAERTLLVGDRNSDIQAAINAGIPGYMYRGGPLDEFVSSLIRVADEASNKAIGVSHRDT